LNLPLADTAVSDAARRQGLIVPPVSTYCLPGTQSPQYNGFVLGYAGVPVEKMEGHVKRLAHIIEQVSGY